MTWYKKLEFSNDLLGTEVSVVIMSGASCRGFEVGEVYKGKLKSKVDWMVGCPVFECKTEMLGLGYECYLVEKV